MLSAHVGSVNVPASMFACKGKTGGVQVYIKLLWHLKYLTSIQS